ncbi:hypothetical protein ACEE97_10690 [Limosilactobacillus reuteri]
MDLTTNNNFLDNINPLDTNSSIPATRDLKDSIHALAMLNGCTMQEYLEQLVSSEINHYDIQKLSNYRKLKFYFDQYYLKKYNLK